MNPCIAVHFLSTIRSSVCMFCGVTFLVSVPLKIEKNCKKQEFIFPDSFPIFQVFPGPKGTMSFWLKIGRRLCPKWRLSLRSLTSTKSLTRCRKRSGHVTSGRGNEACPWDSPGPGPGVGGAATTPSPNKDNNNLGRHPSTSDSKSGNIISSTNNKTSRGIISLITYTLAENQIQLQIHKLTISASTSRPVKIKIIEVETKLYFWTSEYLNQYPITGSWVSQF